ncbi:carboxylate-amine ligase [Planobispora rosea]|uniref:carboxylate-amine ligase n=1 Tax=Planobispora rosea TaxID=35762 RepID=UPI00083B6105|nr:glutamate--cysteine ligase [Planobispora rosea]
MPAGHGTGRSGPPRPGAEALPVGVEEEFFLFDPRTGRTIPRAAGVLDAVRDPDRVQREFAACQVETASSPHTDLGELQRELVRLRSELSGAARRAGCRLTACGSAPFENSATGATVTDIPRYLRIARAYGAIARGEKCCGCHVHVEVPDREEAVQVCNHLRPWFPTLLALTANSPFTAGRDSGYASWRTIAWGRWPTVGPPPLLDSAADYRATVDALVRSGVILDEAMVYWLARPSHHLPTVEVRVADVCATAEETVAYAAIVRALVTTVLHDIRSGVPAPRPVEALLEGAHWRAARDGLEGQGVDPFTGAPVPAWRLVDELMARIGPALAAAGDLPMVTERLFLLRCLGSGAARQRAVYGQRSNLQDVVAWMGRQTAPVTVCDLPLLTSQGDFSVI